jgi:hypothetical protein
MKRLFLLSICIPLLCATIGNAEIIQVSANRTVYDGTWDQVILKITGFVGADVPANYALTGMVGTWSASGGMNLLGTSTTWYNKVLNDTNAQDVAAPQSWVDFALKTPDTATRTGSAGNYTSFFEGNQASLSTTNGFALGPVDVTPGDNGSGNDGYAFDNTLLGVFYINHADTSWVPGATVFTGVGGYARNTGGGALGSTPTTSVQIAVPAPEPSTLVLLGGIGVALSIGWWRKRRAQA